MKVADFFCFPTVFNPRRRAFCQYPFSCAKLTEITQRIYSSILFREFINLEFYRVRISLWMRRWGESSGFYNSSNGEWHKMRIRSRRKSFLTAPLRLLRWETRGSNSCPITAIIKDSARIRCIVIIKFIKKFFIEEKTTHYFIKNSRKSAGIWYYSGIRRNALCELFQENLAEDA